MKVARIGSKMCQRCGVEMPLKRIFTDGSDSAGRKPEPVIVAMCLCDARECAKCHKHTTNPKTNTCAHCGRVF